MFSNDWLGNNAGKLGRLGFPYPNWNDAEQARLINELTACKENKLLENKQLLSKKTENKEGEYYFQVLKNRV
ncbi:MAG: hypothetical protein M0Q26_11190 [Chitinophagaceae bacterium]|nr:hypothetical protein [Chitinophagaceae bacterium]MDP1762839.1 hypothetical protein [Sediminibacterium sp.]MDP1809935.1 hypothetical protein [Sediminibacterium sp.]